MENSLHILLTGDERIICGTLKDYLCNLGHQVEVVRDGHTALKKVNAQHYDLALVDLRMPGINDTEFLAKVQHNRQETPVVLVSGADTVRKVIEAFRLEAGTVLPQSIQLPSVNTGHENGRRLGGSHRSHCNPHQTPKGVQTRKNPDESVDTQEIAVAPGTIACLEQCFTLFYTGIQRRAETILHEQKRSASLQTLLHMKELVSAFYDVLVKGNHKGCPYKNDNRGGCLDEVGHLLHRAWALKRSLCDSISNSVLDTIYERAIAAGALGGKILGAGGGGYFLFYVPTEKQGTVTAALSDLGLSRLGFRFEPKGSQIIEGRNLDEGHYPYHRQRYMTQIPHLRLS